MSVEIFKCGSEEVYTHAFMKMNGLIYSTTIKNGGSRLAISAEYNTKGVVAADKDISIPEGDFKFIYFDCFEK